MSVMQVFRTATGGMRTLALTSSSASTKAAAAAAQPPAHLKRPAGAFLLFKEEKIKSLPKMGVTEASRQLGAQWSKLSDTEKQHYNEMYKSAMDRYKAAREKLPEETLQQEKLASAAKKGAKKLKELTKELKALTVDKPSKYGSSYLIFSAERLPNLKGTGTSMERMRKVASEWEALPADKKAQYENRHKLEMEKYTTGLKNWEQAILKDGRHEKIESVKEKIKALKAKVLS